jgi:hypothetical protein
MISKVFISLTLAALLATLGLIVITNTGKNCWDKYETENAAIENCEQHEQVP